MRTTLSRKVVAAIIRYNREAYLENKAAELEKAELERFWAEMDDPVRWLRSEIDNEYGEMK